MFNASSSTLSPFNHNIDYRRESFWRVPAAFFFWLKFFYWFTETSKVPHRTYILNQHFYPDIAHPVPAAFKYRALAQESISIVHSPRKVFPLQKRTVR